MQPWTNHFTVTLEMGSWCQIIRSYYFVVGPVNLLIIVDDDDANANVIIIS